MEYSLKMYERAVDYNGRLVVLVCDPDQLVMVNKESIKWDGVTPLTVDEIVPFLKFYAREVRKPEDQRTIKYPVGFMDGLPGEYGDSIVFDDNCDPIIKIEDGYIRSTRVICECEKLIMSHAYSATRKAYKETTRLLNNCTFLERTSSLLENTYKCTICGEVWFRKKLFPGSYPVKAQTQNKKWK